MQILVLSAFADLEAVTNWDAVKEAILGSARDFSANMLDAQRHCAVKEILKDWMMHC